MSNSHPAPNLNTDKSWLAVSILLPEIATLGSSGIELNFCLVAINIHLVLIAFRLSLFKLNQFWSVLRSSFRTERLNCQGRIRLMFVNC